MSTPSCVLINALNDEFSTIAVFSAWRASVVCNRSNLVFIIVVCLVGSAFVAYWVSTYIYHPICVYTLTIAMWQVFFITSERTHVYVIETRQIWCQDIPHLSLSSQRASVNPVMFTASYILIRFPSKQKLSTNRCIMISHLSGLPAMIVYSLRSNAYMRHFGRHTSCPADLGENVPELQRATQDE